MGHGRVNQLASGDVGYRHNLPSSDRRPVKFQRARGWQRCDRYRNKRIALDRVGETKVGDQKGVVSIFLSRNRRIGAARCIVHGINRSTQHDGSA